MSQRNSRVVNSFLTPERNEDLRFLHVLSKRVPRRAHRTPASEIPLTHTANGALVHAGSGSALVDFHARATELRYGGETVIAEAAACAYAEDAVMATKLFFQTGDVREGKGERAVFVESLNWLIRTHPHVALELLPLIPEYTRWDHLVRLTISDNPVIADAATALVTKQFRSDLASLSSDTPSNAVRISLLGKWMPSLQAKSAVWKPVVRHLLKALHMTEREYRHSLSALRSHLHVIEKSMSAGDYDRIDMESMTARQQLRYSAFLQRVLREKRHAYIQAVLRGEARLNASVLNPAEICHEYLRELENVIFCHPSVTYNEDLEALWSMLPDRVAAEGAAIAGNTLVVRDGSGSMTGSLGHGTSATMLEAASALAVYCADRLPGAFARKFITFSSSPELVDLSGCQNLAEKLELLYRYDECSNTNIEATFDLILKTAVSGQLAQEELPSYLLILSDMEFDEARTGWRDPIVSRNTLFETIRRKWDAAGYQMPTLVFWNLNGKRTLFPEIDPRHGIIYLSGFSTTELTMVMAGEFEKTETREITETVTDTDTGKKKSITRLVESRVILSPQQQLAMKLSQPRYDAVERAVHQGLLSENNESA